MCKEILCCINDDDECILCNRMTEQQKKKKNLRFKTKNKHTKETEKISVSVTPV